MKYLRLFLLSIFLKIFILIYYLKMIKSATAKLTHYSDYMPYEGGGYGDYSDDDSDYYYDDDYVDDYYDHSGNPDFEEFYQNHFVNGQPFEEEFRDQFDKNGRPKKDATFEKQKTKRIFVKDETRNVHFGEMKKDKKVEVLKEDFEDVEVGVVLEEEIQASRINEKQPGTQKESKSKNGEGTAEKIFDLLLDRDGTKDVHDSNSGEVSPLPENFYDHIEL